MCTCTGRKVCGVLIEQPGVKPALVRPRLVIGVGINVNNSFASAPNDIRATGVSLADQIGEPIDRTSVLIAVLEEHRRSPESVDFTQLADALATTMHSGRRSCQLHYESRASCWSMCRYCRRWFATTGNRKREAVHIRWVDRIPTARLNVPSRCLGSLCRYVVPWYREETSAYAAAFRPRTFRGR